MPKITEDVDDLVAVDKDGNTTISSGAVALWGDTFGSSLGDWDEERASGADISIVEASGQMQYSHTDPISSTQLLAKRNPTYKFSGNFSLEVHYSGSTANSDSGSGTKTRAIWYLEPSGVAEASMGSGDDHVRWERITVGGSINTTTNNGSVRAYKRTSSSSVEVGTTTADNDDDAKFRITRTNDDFEWLRDLGAGWVSHGTATLTSFPGSLVNILWFQSGENHEVNSADHDWDQIIQNSGGIYWKDAQGEWPNKTFSGRKIIDWSTFAVDVTGTVEFDYSTDGGSTYTGTWRTKEQMRALPATRTNQIRLKVRMNGGGETAAATVGSISYNVIRSVVGSLSCSGAI